MLAGGPPPTGVVGVTGGVTVKTVVTVANIVFCETTVVGIISVAVEGGRVVVIVVSSPAMLVVTVIVLAGSVVTLVDIKITVVGVTIVVCAWSEAAVQNGRHCKEVGLKDEEV